MTEAQARQVGRLVARARDARGLSLRAVAETADISYSWLTRLERGDFAAPDPAAMARVAEVLDIDPDRLNRMTRGHVSANLPGVRTYLRTKYDLNPEQIAEVEAIVTRLQREAEDGGHEPGRHHTAA